MVGTGIGYGHGISTRLLANGEGFDLRGVMIHQIFHRLRVSSGIATV